MNLFDNNTYFHCVVLGCANLFTSMILWSCRSLGWAEQQHCTYKAVLFGFDEMSLGQAEQTVYALSEPLDSCLYSNLYIHGTCLGLIGGFNKSAGNDGGPRSLPSSVELFQCMCQKKSFLINFIVKSGKTFLNIIWGEIF